MRIVLDTNVLLSAILPDSVHHWIYQGVFNGDFILCVSTDVLSEYAELLERFYGRNISENVLSALLYSPFVERFSPSYFWSMIIQDPDDNKFVDCAIASSSHYIITSDKHFKILEQISFPKVITIKPEKFKDLIYGS